MQRWNPYETVLGVNNVGDTGVEVELQIPTGNSYDSVSSPAVANGVVYVGLRIDGNVYALNASTGASCGAMTTGGAVDSSPAVANGVVYIGSWRPATLYALNASTGAKLWSFTTGGALESPRPQWRMGWFMSAPTTATCMR